jgi:hypothetical protein
VALTAQALHVAFIVRAAFSQWHDVIALRGHGHAPLSLTHHAQGIRREQLRPHRLQLAAGGALCCGFRL